MSLLESALSYREQGLSVIPCLPGSKTPAVKWAEYQTRIADDEEIRGWWMQNPMYNVGIVTGKVSGITVVDCDSESAITAFQKEFNGSTPTVKTPRGLHYWFSCQEGLRNTVKVAGLDLDIRGESGFVVAPPSIRPDGPYAWETPFNRDSLYSLNNLLSFNSLLKNTNARDAISMPSGNLFTLGSRDNDLFHIANALIKGGSKPEVAREVLQILASQCDPPFPEKEVDIKIQSALERAIRRERNLAAEVEEYVLSTNGTFLSTEVSNCLHLSTREENKNLSMILKRMADKGVIQKEGKRNGHWRKVDDTIDIIEWQNAKMDEYAVKWPLQLENLCKLYPGNIAVLAGASNTGKTGFLLELVRLNQRTRNVIYMNSEMGAEELRLRIQMFHEVCPADKWHFKAIERSSNFADVIDPDGFNIIDFLEIHDEFWKIGGFIREIHEKLKKGIAVIAIQKASSTKNNQKDFGRGGELGLEKPRLYMAMDRGKIKLVKAKIWRTHDRNPNGLMRKFKLVSGWKFIPEGDWFSDKDVPMYGKDNEFVRET